MNDLLCGVQEFLAGVGCEFSDGFHKNGLFLDPLHEYASKLFGRYRSYYFTGMVSGTNLRLELNQYRLGGPVRKCDVDLNDPGAFDRIKTWLFSFPDL